MCNLGLFMFFPPFREPFWHFQNWNRIFKFRAIFMGGTNQKLRFFSKLPFFKILVIFSKSKNFSDSVIFSLKNFYALCTHFSGFYVLLPLRTFGLSRFFGNFIFPFVGFSLWVPISIFS